MFSRIKAYFAAHPKAASITRHGAITFLAAFGVMVLPWVDAILNGGAVDLAAGKAAALAGVAAGLRAVGLWLRGYIAA